MGDWIADALAGVFFYGVLVGIGLALFGWGGFHAVAWLIHHLAWVR